MTAPTPPETFVVKPWSRYGMRRLYIHSDDGIGLGWWDDVEQRAHPDDGVPEAVIEAAVAWYRETRQPAPPRGRAASTDVLPTPAEPPTPVEPPSAEAAAPVAEQRSPIAEPDIPIAEPLGTAPAAPEPRIEGAAAWEAAQAGRSDVVFAGQHWFAPPVPAPSAADPAPAFAPPTPFEDLRTHQAGALVRAKREEVRAEHPRAYLAARIFGIHTEERAWRVGARGEELVGEELARLIERDPRWCVIHSVPIGKGDTDVDHLVIGPGGVFTLNTKHHPGSKIWVGGSTVMVNGRRQPYAAKARGEASRVQRMLAAACGYLPPTQGVLVFVNAGDFTVKEQPPDVHVTYRKGVRPWLLAQPEVLGEAAVTTLYEMARRSTTWR